MNITKVGVVGAGTMGRGIAQVAAQNGCDVIIMDTYAPALENAKQSYQTLFDKLVEKGKFTREGADEIINRIQFTANVADFSETELVIEAIIENIEVKHTVFKQIEEVVSEDCIIASNTSSLSIASIASSLKKPNRCLGIHFFNPAPLMKLVEIIPAVQTSNETLQLAKTTISSWGKTACVAKDTPGFIVNRVARPFYGEAMKIYEEGIADFATIDWAMTHIGGFRMGPFTLMDYIGNDVNYTVTETVFEAFYYDPRFRPSFTQKRHKEAGYYGRKTKRGFYDYSEGAEMPKPIENEALGKQIFNRVLVMLINEAIDAVFLNIASIEDVDLAMTTGVNYPKGLLKWADEIGLDKVLAQSEALFAEYGDDRYRPNPLLRRMVREGKTFY